MSNHMPFGELWFCGDDECNCHQPQIIRYRTQYESARAGTNVETIWKGTFISDPSVEELKMLKKELRDECKRRGVPIALGEDEDAYEG